MPVATTRRPAFRADPFVRSVSFVDNPRQFIAVDIMFLVCSSPPMINTDNLHEAEQEALGQLAQMDLALAARLHQLALNSDEPKDIIELTRAYQRASRCVRQTIMLRAKLRQERERHLAAMKPAGRAAFADLLGDDRPLSPVEARIDTRIVDLQSAASRILAEAAPDMLHPERLDALDRIDAWIDQEVADHGKAFGRQVLDDHVLELCRACDLPDDIGRRFRELARASSETWDTDDATDGDDVEPRAEAHRRDTG